MNKKFIFIFLYFLFFTVAGIFVFAKKQQSQNAQFVSYVADSKKQQLKFYWKVDEQQNFSSIQNLKTWLEQRNQKLVFAMNGGM